MESVHAHYENLLAKHYTWMAGGLESRTTHQAQFFASHDIRPRANAKAIDLGCGSGFQTLPLARLGFTVHAVDFCEPLLEELGNAAAGLPVLPVLCDIRRFGHQIQTQVELIVCMGDTLTHLGSMDEIRQLIDQIRAQLLPGGICIFTFRDLMQERAATDRFFIVRGDHDRIFTCFLEYPSSSHAHIHDLIHLLNGDGTWELHQSSYRKVRINPVQVVDFLRHCGFGLRTHTNVAGMVTIIASR